MRRIPFLLFLGALATALILSSQDLHARQRQPNILFAIADDWSAGHTSLDVKWVRTPGHDRVAREGVRFLNCFTSNPKCSPSRASMLTGRNSWQLEEAFNHFGLFPKRWAVFPDLLESAGYHVGFTGKGW